MGRIIYGLMLILLSISIANAGGYYTSAYGDDIGQPVGNFIKDIVSDDFTNILPSSKYEIVIVYEHTQLGNDNICYAIAGVSRKISQNDTLMPSNRFSYHYINRDSGAYNVSQIRECQAKAIRNAVDNMMSISPKELKIKADK